VELCDEGDQLLCRLKLQHHSSEEKEMGENLIKREERKMTFANLLEFQFNLGK